MTSFANAAARIARDCDPIYDYGKSFNQLDTNEWYRCIRGGTGAQAWELIGRDRVIHYVSVYDLFEVSSGGDVGAIAAIGGRLASDTTPILRGDAAETAEVSWPTGNADIVGFQIPLNPAVSGTGDITVELDVYSGTTNAATFTVESGFDGGALVSDSASDAATLSATRHTISATVAAADIPDGCKQMTVMLTPAAHATDAIQLLGCRVSY